MQNGFFSAGYPFSDSLLEQGQFILLGVAPISPAFPSGHTTGIIALATLIILHSKHLFINILILIFALLASISRIMVGAHWPLDIGGGMILGWGIAFFVNAFIRNWNFDTKKQKFLLFSLLICASLLIFKNTGYPTAYPLQISIALYGIVIALMRITRI